MTPVAVRRWITHKDRLQFHADGYLVIRNVVPETITNNAVLEVSAFMGADLSDSATWYGGAPVLDGIVPLHHAQSLWDIRQCPNLYQVFTEFHGRAQLRVDINRFVFRPPVHPGFPTISHGTIHWDTDPRLPGPGSLQGVVLLTDVGRNGGGFQCLPKVYQNLDACRSRVRRAAGKEREATSFCGRPSYRTARQPIRQKAPGWPRSFRCRSRSTTRICESR